MKPISKSKTLKASNKPPRPAAVPKSKTSKAKRSSTSASNTTQQSGDVLGNEACQEAITGHEPHPYLKLVTNVRSSQIDNEDLLLEDMEGDDLRQTAIDDLYPEDERQENESCSDMVDYDDVSDAEPLTPQARSAPIPACSSHKTWTAKGITLPKKVPMKLTTHEPQLSLEVEDDF